MEILKLANQRFHGLSIRIGQEVRFSPANAARQVAQHFGLFTTPILGGTSGAGFEEGSFSQGQISPRERNLLRWLNLVWRPVVCRAVVLTKGRVASRDVHAGEESVARVPPLSGTRFPKQERGRAGSISASGLGSSVERPLPKLRASLRR